MPPNVGDNLLKGTAHIAPQASRNSQAQTEEICGRQLQVQRYTVAKARSTYVTVSAESGTVGPRRSPVKSPGPLEAIVDAARATVSANQTYRGRERGSSW